MGAEQSNTSVVFDERLVLKVFRRIEPGINPELEMLRFLAARGFPNVASLLRLVRLHRRADGRDARRDAAVRDRWARRLGARSRLDRRRPWRLPRRDSPSSAASPGGCTTRSPRTPAIPTSHPRRPRARTCRCSPRPSTSRSSVCSWTSPRQPGAGADRRAGGGAARLSSALSHTGAGGRLIRLHGDYHLGQTVNGPDGWIILDFEGEPARPLLERRRKRSPLRDVAGHAALVRLRGLGRGPAARRVGARAVGAGRPRAASSTATAARSMRALLPAGDAAIANLLALFELEKAVYELRYELNHRPEWVTSRWRASRPPDGQTPA